jgi:8-oxo-dGTP pyrophosphatase MutT (NUDIX family)
MARIAYVGVLPFATNPKTGENYFLLGQEHAEEGWNDQNKWAHFGGGMEVTDKSPLFGSAREAYEESMGFLGSLEEITSKLQDDLLLHQGTLYVYLMRIPYDPELPKTYKNVYEYFLRCATPHPRKKGHFYIPSCPEGYFEKTAVGWFPTKALNRLVSGKSWNAPGTPPPLRHGFDSILRKLFREFENL